MSERMTPQSAFSPQEKTRDISVIERFLKDALSSKGDPVSEESVHALIGGEEERLAHIEKMLAEWLHTRHEVSPQVLRLLGMLTQERSDAFVTKELAWNLEADVDFLDPQSVHYIQENIKSTDPKTNVAFHKVLDFVHQHTVTIQDPSFGNEFEEVHPYRSHGFFVDFCLLAEGEMGNCKNYLVKKHLQDILETARQVSSEKPGALHGVAGGTSDNTIYTFAHVKESYNNRLRLGINEGYPIANPVLPLAPGFLGYYENGQLTQVFKDRNDGQSVEDKERKYVERNHPDDEYIYETLNSFDIKKLGAGRQHPSNGLVLLQEIWDFEDAVRRGNRSFYYDMSRINPANLHPMVIGTLYTSNQQYRDRIEKKENESAPLSKEEFMRALYPQKGYTPDEFYRYKNLSKLHMRKKIEEDFHLDLSKCDLWVQRSFLEFLETRDIENVEKLRVFVSAYGDVGLKTFLSLEYGKELGDDIVEMGEQLPQETAQKIFSKYGELVDAAEQAAEYVGAFKQANTDQSVAGEVRESMLKRGRELLAGFVDRIKKGERPSAEDIERELELVRGDATLFAATFGSLSKRGEQISLSDIRDASFESHLVGGDFSPKDKERMKELYRMNYMLYPKFQDMLLKRFDAVLQDRGSRFFVFRFKGQIEGFYRLGSTALDTVYFGAFNMNPRYRGSGIGEALMQQSLDQVAKDNVIEASCTATEAIASNYIERGFVGYGGSQVEEIYSMDIVRNDTKKELFASKALTAEAIMQSCGQGDLLCTKVSFEELSSRHFELLNRKEGDSRYVLTRYIRDKKNRHAYLVFERLSEEKKEHFKTPEKPFVFTQSPSTDIQTKHGEAR